ncbi:MAG: DUF1697 domain-containing protein [Comamonadaceae bacterium]|nr:DUF1697 domain-containing protein [Comamonadaceae bacterium]
MTTPAPALYLAFLRGVMPSGKNAVKMAALRQALDEEGLGPVRTWIQSGNVLLHSALDASATAARVRQCIRQRLGPDLPVIVKTPEQVNAVLLGNPFTGSGHDLSRVFFSLSQHPPPPARAAALMAQDFGDEKLHIGPYAAYLYLPGSAARSRLGNHFLEKHLHLEMTTRNANTLGKMLALAACAH